jgi:hypothetical protein
MKQLRKFLSLTPSDRRLLVRALLLLGSVRLALRLLPFQAWRKFLAKMTLANTELQKKEREPTDRVVWAVTVASRYMPSVKCLARALTTQILLAQRGDSASLRIGVAKSEEGQLDAHAWVESQGRVVMGGLRDLSRYTPLLSLEGKRS